MEEIGELVIDHLELVGPDISEIKSGINEHDEEIQSVIEKCNSMSESTTDQETQ